MSESEGPGIHGSEQPEERKLPCSDCTRLDPLGGTPRRRGAVTAVAKMTEVGGGGARAQGQKLLDKGGGGLGEEREPARRAVPGKTSAGT